MTNNLPTWIRQHLAALRALLVLTLVLGIVYPLVITAVAQIPGLQARADGSLIKSADGQIIGSKLVGQAFTDANGNPLPQYFQSRPSAATANVSTGYDPTATGASNLGPESVSDSFDDPATKRHRRKQPEPADPGLQPQPRGREAERCRRQPAVLHRLRCRRGPRRLPPRPRLPGPRHPGRQRQRGMSDLSLPRHLSGGRGATATGWVRTSRRPSRS